MEAHLAAIRVYEIIEMSVIIEIIVIVEITVITVIAEEIMGRCHLVGARPDKSHLTPAAGKIQHILVAMVMTEETAAVATVTGEITTVWTGEEAAILEIVWIAETAVLAAISVGEDSKRAQYTPRPLIVLYRQRQRYFTHPLRSSPSKYPLPVM